MKDSLLYKKLGLERALSNAPYYCGTFEKMFHASLRIEAWEQYGEGYTPSYVEISCPLLTNGQAVFYASGNEFSLATIKKILNTLRKCLEFYK